MIRGSLFGPSTGVALNDGSMVAYLPPDAVAGPASGIEPLPFVEASSQPRKANRHALQLLSCDKEQSLGLWGPRPSAWRNPPWFESRDAHETSNCENFLRMSTALLPSVDTAALYAWVSVAALADRLRASTIASLALALASESARACSSSCSQWAVQAKNIISSTHCQISAAQIMAPGVAPARARSRAHAPAEKTSGRRSC